jgi:hypothetical protein
MLKYVSIVSAIGFIGLVVSLILLWGKCSDGDVKVYINSMEKFDFHIRDSSAVA